MPRAPRKEQKRKPICETCRRKKQKCTLPQGATPSSTPLPDAQSCKGCQHRGTPCVLLPYDDGTHEPVPAAHSPPSPKPTESSASVVASSTQRRRAPRTRPLEDETRSWWEAHRLAHRAGRGRDRFNVHALMPRLAAMLLQEQSFGSGLHTQSYNVWDWFHQQLNVSQFNAQEIEAHLDVIRLSFPSLPWYSIVLNVTRLNASDLPAHLLLYTMLWLVLPRLDGVKTGVYHMVTTIIEELGNKFLSGRGKADDVFAPQAFDLLFAFWPLALGNERPAGKRASRPFVFGSQLLRANLRFSPRDRNISSYHRLYCGLLAAPQWIPEGFETSSCFDPPNTLLGWIGFVAVRQRMELLSLIKRYEDKLERLEDQFGEPLPSDRLAGQLVTLFEAFVGEVAGEREYLATILSRLPDLDSRHKQQAKRCLAAHFEQLSLAFSINFASYITAVNLRTTVAPLKKQAVERAIGQPGSSVARLASLLARRTKQFITQSLALTPLISGCTDVAYGLPTVERAMILCTTTKHLVHNLAGQIFFERKKPANLEESIVLLEVAGQAAMNGEQGRIQHMFDRGPKTASELTSDAIEHGDAFVAAGRLAHRASSTLRVWRDRLYEDSVSHEREKAGLALIGVDEVMNMPGLFCEDESGLEGRGAAYQHGQRKERLLAQLWVASRGEDD